MERGWLERDRGKYDLSKSRELVEAGMKRKSRRRYEEETEERGVRVFF